MYINMCPVLLVKPAMKITCLNLIILMMPSAKLCFKILYNINNNHFYCIFVFLALFLDT